MTTDQRSDLNERTSVYERFVGTVCRRAFSSPEAAIYEATIAPALFRIVAPVLSSTVTQSPVLDVGCGGGRLTVELSGKSQPGIVGIDSSVSQIKRLARRARRVERCFAALASATALPFTDGSFGTVVSSCALKHWRDPRLGLSECVRVTRPGGRLVIVEIDGASTIDEVRRFSRLSRVPVGIRRAYVRFAMRTVVGVAPDLRALRAVFECLDVSELEIHKLDGLPFAVVTATVL